MKFEKAKVFKDLIQVKNLKSIDLEDLLELSSPSTFCVRVFGNSMSDAGITDGSFLLVDRTLRPEPGRIIVADLNGTLLVKRLLYEGAHPLLVSDAPTCVAFKVEPQDAFSIWGIVVQCIRPL